MLRPGTPLEAGTCLNPAQKASPDPSTQRNTCLELCGVKRYLHSEAPHGAHRDAGDGPEMVGGHDGTLCSAAYTGHALSCGKDCVSTGEWGQR